MNNSYYNVSHSRDYYKGKSVEFAGEWTSGMRYFNDEYLNSLVVYTEKDATGNIIHSALLACKKTHIAAYNNSIPDSTNNQPHLVINDNLGVIGIEPNDYWIFVSGSLIGTPGKSTEIVNTYLEAITLATENNISKIVFVKEEKSIYFIVGVGELRKIVSTSDFSELFESKVDKEPGKGLSTNDYSNSEKEKLKGIEENAQRNIIEEVDLNGVKIDPINKTISIDTVESINEQTGNITLRDNSENTWDVNLHIENNQIQGKVVTPKSVGSETTPVYFNGNGEVTPINIDTEVTENSNNLVTSNAVHKKLGTKQDTLIAGNGIKIENNKIDTTSITESETQPNTSIWVNPAENTEVELTYNRSQIDTLVGLKQDKLIAGNGIQIVDSTISSTVDTNPFIVVSNLPSVGENGKIYLTPAEKPENNNLADEWIWNNNSWERLGSASVDLSNYPKLVDLTDIINNEADNYITEARFNELKELLSTPNTIFSFNKNGMYYYSASIDLSKISNAPSGNDFESINNIVIYFPIKQDSSGVYGYELVLVSGFDRSSYDFWWSINLTPTDFSVRVYNGERSGLVPTPTYGSTKKYLNVNGQWTTVKSSELDNDSGFITASDIATKQDIISDLNTIREGANKGSTALQSESDPIYIADKPNIAFKNEIPDISVKVDKEEGKGLSSNDYTSEEKAKLASLENYNDTEIKKLINQKVNDTDLAKVAKTGKYSDLIDEPLIKSSQTPTNNEPLWVNPDEDPEEVEVYNRSQVDALLNTKQDTLIPGNGIIIEGNVISSTGSGGSIDLSPYAKKTDVETALAGKQDIIPDLADIKEGANKGKTALQSYNETDPIYTADKPNLALKSELATKQDKLTAGNGISIKDNKIGVTTITESESQPSTHLWVNPSEDAETNVTYNRSQIDALVGAKQDTLQLTVKDNGNIVLANIQGQSKEFMPATPSGDPMHYIYEAYGCVWNGDEDRQVATPWTEYADNEEDKVVIHKKGCWLLNGIGDLTTNEIRKICARGLWNSSDRYALGYSVGMNKERTLLYRAGEQNGVFEQAVSAYNAYIISINLSNSIEENKLANLSINNAQGFILSTSLKYIFGGFLVVNNYIPNVFKNCAALRICRIKTKKNLYLGDSPYFNNYCIRYAIENNLATENISITLHADAYARAMANADIVAALEAHPNVSLASV